MAAKTLDEAIKKGICIGPLANIEQTLKNELRDYFAHRTMILGEEASALDLFNDVFKDIPAFKGGSNDK